MPLGVRSSCSNSQSHLKIGEGTPFLCTQQKAALRDVCNVVAMTFDTKNRIVSDVSCMHDANGGWWYVVTCDEVGRIHLDKRRYSDLSVISPLYYWKSLWIILEKSVQINCGANLIIISGGFTSSLVMEPPKEFNRVIISLENSIIPEEALENTPSRKDGIPESLEMDLRIVGCDYILSAGLLLKLPQVG